MITDGNRFEGLFFLIDFILFGGGGEICTTNSFELIRHLIGVYVCICIYNNERGMTVDKALKCVWYDMVYNVV